MVLGLRVPRLEAVGHELWQVDRHRPCLCRVRASEREQALDEAVETLDFGERTLELCLLRGRRVPLQVLELETEGGERRAQLVGGVCDEVFL